MRLIADELFRVQASASQSLSLTTTKESSKANAHRPELPSFSPGYRVMFYHHRPGGRSHKLATTWSGPYRVVHRRFQEYSIASEDTGVVVNRVHGRFLQRYLTPWQETEGGIVEIPADLRQVVPPSRRQDPNKSDPSKSLPKANPLPGNDVTKSTKVILDPGSFQIPDPSKVPSSPTKVPAETARGYPLRFRKPRLPLKTFSSPK